MTQWFRSWHGAPTDSKWLVIAKRSGSSPAIVSAIVWALFDHASQQPERGSVASFDQETYAVWSGVSEDEVANVITALEEKGVIVDGHLSAWEKRQPKREDDSRERVRAYRERNASNKEEVTQSNAPVTPCNADVTQRNAPEKNRTDTETEEEGELAASATDESDELIAEISPTEWHVVRCVQAVRGAATVNAMDVVLQLREILEARGSPISDEAIRLDAIAFREHWNEKRASQPVNARWRSWKRAMTNWFSRTKTIAQSAPNGRRPTREDRLWDQVLPGKAAS